MQSGRTDRKNCEIMKFPIRLIKIDDPIKLVEYLKSVITFSAELLQEFNNIHITISK